MQDSENPLFFGTSGVSLEDLYILEIRQVAKASFQPILAVKKERALWLNYRPSIMTDVQYKDDYFSEAVQDVQRVQYVEKAMVHEGIIDYSGYGYLWQ